MSVLVVQNDKYVSTFVGDGPQRVRPAAYVLGDIPTPTHRSFRPGSESVSLSDPEITSTYRTSRREKGESISAVRGLMFGVLFAVPAWGLIIWGAISIGSALSS